MTGILEVSADRFKAVLTSLSIGPGSRLLVHSAVQYLGRPAGGLQMYLSVLREVIGPEGTLAVPAFNFGFAKGEPFDPARTPSKGMGVFSELVRQQPDARRTSHPMQSLAVIGSQSDDLAGRDVPCAFDPGSAFERMLDLDFRLLLLGADVQAVSMIHYAEQRAMVPYRYWKEFTGAYHIGDHYEQRTYRMFVRDLQLDPHLDLHPVQRALETDGKWQQVELNYGKVSSCRLVDFNNAAEKLLAENPWALVSYPPGNSA